LAEPVVFFLFGRCFIITDTYFWYYFNLWFFSVRQAGFMPLDKQAVAERALKLGRGTQAVIGTSSG